jgi:ABC-type branched-subunit amino acid transport system ATPase component
VNGELAIRLRGAVKRYGPITAVDGLDLDVPIGTCVGLLGLNGASSFSTVVGTGRLHGPSSRLTRCRAGRRSSAS